MNTKTTPIRSLTLLPILLLSLLAILSTPAWAQNSDPTTPTSTQTPTTTPEPGLESPRATLRTFLTGITGQSTTDTQEALKCLNFPPGLLQSTKIATARDLYEVLNRLEYIVYTDHPDASYKSSTYIFYPNTTRSLRHLAWSQKYPNAKILFTRDDQGSWRFSRSTVDSIQSFWIATENETPAVNSIADKSLIQRIRSSVPQATKGKLVLGLEPWQWLGILLVVFLGIIADQIVRAILRTGWHRFEIKRGNPVEKISLGRAVRPFGMLAASGVWYLALDQGLLPPTATTILLVAVRLFFMISMVWAAFRVADLIGDWLSAQAAKTETKFDDLLVPMIKRTAKLFIAAIGLIYIASAFQIEIMPLLTGLGIGGLAFAFAAKDTIENLFGSIAVILDRPFEIGDWVLINDVEGTVEDLGFRSTRVRTFYNSLVTIPNATLVRATVDNYGRRKYRRFTTKLNVTYDTHPEKIEAFCAGIREIVKLHPYTRKDYYHVWLNSFGPHSLDILVYIFFECPDWSIELREKHRFMLDVVRLADKLGVEFAFPTQKLHLVQDDPSLPHTAMDTPDTNAERRSVLDGRKAAREITSEQPWKQDLPGAVLFAQEFDSEHEARGDSAG
ncbi:MAG: mechanosensitive ion channel family protein [Phycisphaerales bacterium]|nr:mechanosensitive ion channel family protein [Phycisphaerales bacterium]